MFKNLFNKVNKSIDNSFESFSKSIQETIKNTIEENKKHLPNWLILNGFSEGEMEIIKSFYHSSENNFLLEGKIINLKELNEKLYKSLSGKINNFFVSDGGKGNIIITKININVERINNKDEIKNNFNNKIEKIYSIT